MPNAPGEVVLACLPVVVAILAVLWTIQLRTRNAGTADIGWATSLGVLAIGYAAFSPAALPHRLLVALLGGGWSFRLASHLYQRVVGHPEEGRYETLRERWGPRATLYFLLVYGAQVVLALIMSVPFLITAFRPEPKLTPGEWIGAVVWLIGIVGEFIADRQLARFKADPENRGKTCRVGLWNYSRHPNYFFEWVTWVGFAAMAFGAPWGWLGLVGPAAILFLLLKVTGIPPTEAQAVKSRGDDYREYQRTTSAFFPWFPKRDRA